MTARADSRRVQLLAEMYDGLDRRRIDACLDDLAEVVDLVREDWPSWARSLLDMLEAVEAAGAGGPSAGVSDPTTASVIRREKLTGQRDDVLGYIDQALSSIRAARNLMATTARTANAAQLERDLQAQRCTGGMGMPGCDEWGDPTCTDLGGRRRDGLCDRHYMRRHRWTAAQELRDPADRGRYR